VCKCVCVCVRVSVWLHLCVCLCVRENERERGCLRVCVCVRARARACARARVYVYLCVCVSLCLCLCLYVCVRMRACSVRLSANMCAYFVNVRVFSIVGFASTFFSVYMCLCACHSPRLRQPYFVVAKLPACHHAVEGTAREAVRFSEPWDLDSATIAPA